MKKILFIFVLLFSGLAGQAARTQGATVSRRQIIQTVAQAHPQTNAGALQLNKRIDFFITEKIYNPQTGSAFGPYMADLACKAYALDKHWLLVSATCMRPDNADLWEEDDHKYLERYERRAFHLDNTPFTNYKANNRVMLVWQDETTYTAPFINVLATRAPRQLADLNQAGHTLQIHTARLGQNSPKTRQMDHTALAAHTFKLKENWTSLSGTATDPLFVISPEGNEFLAAYNDGYLHYWYVWRLDDLFHKYNGLPSDTWYNLTLEDLFFIRQTVLEQRPQDWPHIQTRLFYNTTQTPYF